MPSTKIHCAISRERTNGNNFKELHEWIDSGSKKLGYNHRKLRHAYNKKDEDTIREWWDKKGEGLGQKAVVEWLFHIAVDNLYTAFKRAKKVYGYKTFNFFRFGLKNESKYIFFDFKPLSDERLFEEFKSTYYENEDNY